MLGIVLDKVPVLAHLHLTAPLDEGCEQPYPTDEGAEAGEKAKWFA